jgi:titin
VTLSGGGFASRATIVITFHSTPLVVGAAMADASGRFSVTVTVPAHAAVGQHHFDASGPAPAGGQTVLDAPIGVTLLHGGSSWVLPVVMIILTLLLAAAAVVALTRVGSWTRRAAG